MQDIGCIKLCWDSDTSNYEWLLSIKTYLLDFCEESFNSPNYQSPPCSSHLGERNMTELSIVKIRPGPSTYDVCTGRGMKVSKKQTHVDIRAIGTSLFGVMISQVIFRSSQKSAESSAGKCGQNWTKSPQILRTSYVDGSPSRSTNCAVSYKRSTT